MKVLGVSGVLTDRPELCAGPNGLELQPDAT